MSAETPTATPTPRISDKMGGSCDAPPVIKKSGGSFIAPNAPGSAAAPQPDGVRDDLGRATADRPRFSAADEIIQRGLDPSSDQAKLLGAVESDLRGRWGSQFEEKATQARWAASEINTASGGALNGFLDETGLGDAGIELFGVLADALGSGPLPYITDGPSAAQELDARMDGRLSALLTAAGLSSDQRVMGFFDHVATLMQRGVSNPMADARRRLNEILNDKGHAYYSRDDRVAHEVAVREVRALYARVSK